MGQAEKIVDAAALANRISNDGLLMVATDPDLPVVATEEIIIAALLSFAAVRKLEQPAMIDQWDENLAEKQPRNSLERRSIRVLNEQITELERRLEGLRFVRETMQRHLKE